MLMILSPSKRLDFESAPPQSFGRATSPPFLEQSAALIEVLREYEPRELSTLMKLSSPLAALNHERYQRWHAEGERAALAAFQGDVYRGLDAASLSPEASERAHDQLRVLSGLYGLLAPSDLIRPHRLEMGTRLKLSSGTGLYQVWREPVSAALRSLCAAGGHRALLNLASKEYSRAVELDDFPAPVVTPSFVREKDGQRKIVAIHAKRARGLMARFVLEEGLREPSELSAFCAEGYAYDPESPILSPVFVRQADHS